MDWFRWAAAELGATGGDTKKNHQEGVPHQPAPADADERPRADGLVRSVPASHTGGSSLTPGVGQSAVTLAGRRHLPGGGAHGRSQSLSTVSAPCSTGGPQRAPRAAPQQLRQAGNGAARTAHKPGRASNHPHAKDLEGDGLGLS